MTEAAAGATPHPRSDPQADLPDLESIRRAQEALTGVIHRTPLLSCRSLGAWLKAESLQRAGSFKIRGAYTKMVRLSDEQRSRGVITYSSGNHAQGVALAARLLGIAATVVMPEDVIAGKRSATEGYGAAVELVGYTSADRKRRAEAIAAESGAVIIPPFDDADILAGQATVGLEILEDLPDVGTVLVPVGGGGVLGGIALAIRAVAGDDVAIYAVEPEGADAMCRSLEAGSLHTLERPNTVADGLRPVAPGVRNLAAAQATGVQGVRVTDDEILDAMRFLAERARLVVEPSGAAAAAALLSRKVTPADHRPVVAVVTGGNVAPGLLAQVLTSPTT
jgi:threonine dehydratase